MKTFWMVALLLILVPGVEAQFRGMGDLRAQREIEEALAVPAPVLPGPLTDDGRLPFRAPPFREQGRLYQWVAEPRDGESAWMTKRLCVNEVYGCGSSGP